MYSVLKSMSEILNYDVANTKTPLDLTEMKKLAKGLEDRKISFSRNKLFGGEQIIVLDEYGNRLWDAVLHYGSYGHEKGLLEVMGESVVRIDYDEVEGYLTSEEILSRIS